MYCTSKMRANRRLVQGEENARGWGSEKLLYVKKHSTDSFGSTGKFIVGSIQKKSQILDSADHLNMLGVG